MTVEKLQQNANGAEQAIIVAGVAIIAFAIMRGLFSFVQGYMGEKLSQSVAFDLRNELFSKIQRLSFSYHDRNQTGQLMIRATDDVEKVRMFIGQGLMLAFQAIVLLVSTLIILMLTNCQADAGRAANAAAGVDHLHGLWRGFAVAVRETPAKTVVSEHHPAREPGRNPGRQGVCARTAGTGALRDAVNNDLSSKHFVSA